MNTQETKRILSSYRPGSHAVVDMEVGAALSEVERDAGLRAWFEGQNAFHGAIRRCVGEIPVPSGLPERILAAVKIVPMRPWWQSPIAWGLAATFAVLAGLFLAVARPFAPENWGRFRDRMVAWSVHEYRMDIVTNQMTALREFHASRGTPSDYSLPAGLAKLPPMGGGSLTWRDHPASMVCLNFENRSVLYLFVIESEAVRLAPPTKPTFSKHGNERLLTASWTEGNKSYLLAAPIGTGDLHQFF